jgi:hypothetical protein
MGDIMKAYLEQEVGRLQALQQRCAELQKLASILSSDDRWKSTPLEVGDPLVQQAQACKAQIGIPLTLGTLLAAVLSQLESVQEAIHVLERQLCVQVLFAEHARMQSSLRHGQSGY